MSRLRTALISVVAALTALAVLAGCGFNPTSLPLKGTRVSGDKYSIGIQFESVLNLPDKAKVTMRGANVGVVREVTLEDQGADAYALAHVDVQAQVDIPKGTRAELKQATILGDIYVDLLPPATSSANMQPGDVIGHADTVPAQQLEQVLGGLASLINGGSLQRVQDLVTAVNEAVPSDPNEITRVVNGGRQLLAEATTNTDSFDKILHDAAQLGAQLNQQRQSLVTLLDVLPGRLVSLDPALQAILDLLATIGGVFEPVGKTLDPHRADLLQMVGVIDPLLQAVTRVDTSGESNLEKVRNLLQDKLAPWLSQQPPAADINKVSINGNPAQLDPLISILRSIGVLQ